MRVDMQNKSDKRKKRKIQDEFQIRCYGIISQDTLNKNKLIRINTRVTVTIPLNIII